MRFLSTFMACLLVGASVLRADVLVNTGAQNNTILDPDESLTVELADLFQAYSDPGPVATFTYMAPVQAGYQELYFADKDFQPVYDETRKANIMTYELAGGGSYTQPFEHAARAGNFVWTERTVQFQLLADQAPLTVSNFVIYVNQDAFDKTIVHRATQFRQDATTSEFLQAGRYRLNDSDDYLLWEIERRTTVPFEQTIANAAGTLAMARGSSVDSGSSELFINLADNSDALIFNDGSPAYSVFGQLIDTQTSLPVLAEMGDTYVLNLSNYYGTIFETLPLYSPVDILTLNAKDNFLRFDDISVPQGSQSGITHSFEFADTDGVEGTSETEAANQAAFNVSLAGGQLQISRGDTGQVRLIVKGTLGEQELTTSFFLTAFNEGALRAFPNSNIEQGGFLLNAWYGHMMADTFPEIIHDNHGQQWVYYTTSEFGSPLEFYIYDAKLQSWIWTTQLRYPLLYVYEWNTWVRYARTTGNGDDIPRWFYNFTTQGWVTD